MKKIRIGKDFRILWGVTVNGEALKQEDSGKLELVLVNPRLSAVSLPFYILDGKVVAEIKPEYQKYLGVHKLTLWYTSDDGKKGVLDEVNPYCLVKFTSEEDWREDNNDFDTDVDVDISGDIQVTGRGESAYEIWLKNGYTGTEVDFLDWLRQNSEFEIKKTGKEYRDDII
jgi:hypothetical protein